MMENKLVVFQNKEIRRTLHNNEWWFSVVDVCHALTGSVDAGAYWRKLKQRLKQEGTEPVTNCHGLKLPAPDGKMRETDCANTEGIFRIIQSIPSPKAEPFKRWLAKVGYERVQEIENPELATARTRELYRAKGYSEAWIEKRMRGIAVRAELTEEWKNRGINGVPEYAILTAEISRGRSSMRQLLNTLYVMPALSGRARMRRVEAETCQRCVFVLRYVFMGGGYCVDSRGFAF